MNSDLFKKISLEKVQKLTLAVCKVTDLLDERDPLRADLRRESVIFFSHVNLGARGYFGASAEVLRESIHRICGYLQLAKHLPGLAHIRMDFLEMAYMQLEKQVGYSPAANILEKKASAMAAMPPTSRSIESKSLPKPSMVAPTPLSDRQQFMLQFALTHKRFQLKELANHFPSLSEKTIRNDLLLLCEHGLIGRFGIAPRSYYQVINNAETSMTGTEYMFSHTETSLLNAESTKTR